MQSETIITILYKRLIGGELTADESNLLNHWLDENPESRRRIMDELSDIGIISEEYKLRERIDFMRPYRDMCDRLGIEPEMKKYDQDSQEMDAWMVHESTEADIEQKPRFKMSRFLKYAASIVILASPLLYLVLTRNNGNEDVLHSGNAVALLDKSEIVLNELAPGKTQAIVTLPGGDTVHLPLTGKRAATEIDRLKEGKLQIDVPRGGEFTVVLEDSTRVWLNSESRLYYPAHFSGTERNVELIGEAYFDVAHQSGKPFTVATSGQKVTVYGTEFNIRSYPEEKSVYTTLSVGSVGLSRLDGAGGEIRLSPGKQAVFDKETSSARVRQVDIERVTGWRHGRFVFEEQSLKQIMTDLSRWYDFNFEFADEEAAETIFMGSIPRYSNFKTAIAILEKSGGLIFSVKDNKVIISKE